MKSLFRVSILGFLMLAVVGVSNLTVAAQTDPKADLYEKFTSNYNGDLEQQKIAVAAGKEFIQKYGASEDDKAIIDYLKGAIPSIEQSIKDEEIRLAEEEKRRQAAAERAELLKKFNAAFKDKNWNNFFNAGESILKSDPEFYDIAVILATAGFDEAANKNDSFNERTIKHAEFAIGKLSSGAKPRSDTCGGNYYPYKTDDFANCVPNAQGWMNYYIGWIKSYRQQKKDEAIPYFFEATKYNSGASELPTTYQAIGAWYVQKASGLIEERNAILEERNAETKLPEPDELKIKGLDERIDQKIAMERGYADRAIDAYSRAYSLVPAADRTKTYATGIFSTLQNLYKLRYYEKPEMQTDAAINMNVSMIKSKKMPDPSTDVQPIVDAKPAVAPDSTETNTGASRSRTVTSKASSNN